MRDELYINGIKVDLGKTNIDLNYKSNLLSDISKIVSNNSYTIKLPKTAKNLSLIECAHIPSSVSRFPYLKHAGTLIRDGIEIVKNANVVLLETNESIEIALSWGNVINFANVANNGKKLTDLSHGTMENVDWAVWKNWGGASSIFPKIDYGFNSEDQNVWYHPVMKVSEIMDKIQSDNDVTFDIPNDKLEVMNKMIIPLLTKNDSQELYDKYPINLKGNTIGSSTQSYNSERLLDIHFNGDSSQKMYGEDAKVTGTNISGNGFKSFVDSEKAKLKGIVLIGTSDVGKDPWQSKLVIRANKENGERAYLSYISPTTANESGSIWNIGYNVNFMFDINKNDILFLSYMPDTKPSMIFEGDVAMVNLNLTVSPRGELLFGEKFPFVPNLPDIKQIDFIKAITSMLGLFAIPGESNTIKFIPFDNLKDNILKAVDWTSKVVKAYRESVPRSMKYAVDNTAQNNRFLYKEDDSVKGNYDGNLKIEDSTLDFERDAIKLHFSACDTNNGVASIPVYSYNDKGELQYKKVNPRLLLLEGTNGVFKGIEWETLLKNNYSTYKGMVNEAKVLTEHVRLNSIELRDLEMDVPVYLGQYGCYLAIIEIKTKENDVCECKLLKLEV